MYNYTIVEAPRPTDVLAVVDRAGVSVVDDARVVVVESVEGHLGIRVFCFVDLRDQSLEDSSVASFFDEIEETRRGIKSPTQRVFLATLRPNGQLRSGD
jgi:hypothetical protein